MLVAFLENARVSIVYCGAVLASSQFSSYQLEAIFTLKGNLGPILALCYSLMVPVWKGPPESSLGKVLWRQLNQRSSVVCRKETGNPKGRDCERGRVLEELSFSRNASSILRDSGRRVFSSEWSHTVPFSFANVPRLRSVGQSRCWCSSMPS